MKEQEKAQEIINKQWEWIADLIEKNNLSKEDRNQIRFKMYGACLDMHDWTKNELLKNATDIRINRDFLADIKQYIHEKYFDYKVGEKVKLVLIKDE